MAMPPKPSEQRVSTTRPTSSVSTRPSVSGGNLASRFGYQKRTLSDVESRITEASSNFKTYHNTKFKEFKPRDGENCIRILPALGFQFPKHVARHYGITVFLHYLMSTPKATVICPARSPEFRPVHIEDKCPVCEDVAHLYATGQSEKIKTLRIKPQKKVITWILDNKNTASQDPMIFAMPYTLDLDFTKLCKDRGTGEIYNIDSPDDGYNIYFDRSKELGGVKYLSPQRDQRPSAVDISVLEYVNSNPLPNVLTWRTYDELRSLYGGSTAASIGDSEDEKFESPSSDEEADSSSIDTLISAYDSSFDS